MSSECNEAKPPPLPPLRGTGNDSSVRLSAVWHNSKPVPLVTPSPPLMLQSLQIIAAARKVVQSKQENNRDSQQVFV